MIPPFVYLGGRIGNYRAIYTAGIQSDHKISYGHDNCNIDGQNSGTLVLLVQCGVLAEPSPYSSAPRISLGYSSANFEHVPPTYLYYWNN